MACLSELVRRNTSWCLARPRFNGHTGPHTNTPHGLDFYFAFDTRASFSRTQRPFLGSWVHTYIHVVVSGLANKVQPLRMASSSCTASSVNKYDDMYRLAFTTFSFSFSEFFCSYYIDPPNPIGIGTYPKMRTSSPAANQSVGIQWPFRSVSFLIFLLLSLPPTFFFFSILLYFCPSIFSFTILPFFLLQENLHFDVSLPTNHTPLYQGKALRPDPGRFQYILESHTI
ncbi:hypothetical protein CH063_12287 [Colletotrichum higginsianum]|uniref:Uncharacterized protein n=1 Tax=Colletotrichum higginsianum (strain IMI 349063) TaxID=759273 RepID=H1VPR1_COLHI|nr:hypothetical protein CH063_12287 [Colletotrichum higginsianum]